MKSTLMLLVFMVLTAGLTAQIGLFGLSFGDNHSKCVSLLLREGFVQTAEPSANRYVFTSEAEPEIESIVLQFEETADKLYEWEFSFSFQDDGEAVFDMVMELLIDIHGEDFSYNEKLAHYTWTSDKVRAVYLEWDFIKGQYYVKYRNKA